MFAVDGYYCMSRAKQTSHNRFEPKIENENSDLACGSAGCKLCTDTEGRFHFLLIDDICLKYSGPGGKEVSAESSKRPKKKN